MSSVILLHCVNLTYILPTLIRGFGSGGPSALPTPCLDLFCAMFNASSLHATRHYHNVVCMYSNKRESHSWEGLMF